MLLAENICFSTILPYISVTVQDFGLQVHLLCNTGICSSAMRGAADSCGDWRVFLAQQVGYESAGRPSISLLKLSKKSGPGDALDDPAAHFGSGCSF